MFYPFDETASDEKKKERRRNIERQIRRELSKLHEEQLASGLTVVHVKEGRQIKSGDDLVNIPNEFTLPILPLLKSALNEFKEQTGKNRMRTAARIAIEKAGAQLKIPPKSTTRRDPDQLLLALKNTLSWAERYAEKTGDKRTAYDKLIAEITELRDHGGRTPLSGGLLAIQADLTVLPDSCDSESGVPLFLESHKGDSTSEVIESQGGCDSEELASEAQRALDAFLSVEAYPDEVLFLNDETEEREGGRKINTAQLKAELDDLVFDARQGGASFIVRIRGPLQIDDCTREEMEFLSRFAFASFETSPNNFQTWLAFADDDDKATARDRLFAGLRQLFPGTKLNAGSGGAIRWPGSLNLKPNRRLPDGSAWSVRMVHAEPGRIVTPSELDEFGLLADIEPVSQPVESAPARSGWPDYEATLKRALLAGKTHSEADASWVTSSILFYKKRDREEIAARLREVSQHARENEPQKYAIRSVNKVGDHLNRKGVTA